MKCKRILVLLCVGCLLLTTAACGETDGKRITLSDEDVALLEEVKDDITVVNDDNYVETVSSFNSNSASLAGHFFQIEGLIRYEETDSEETAFLYRNYEGETGTSELGVALRYLPEKLEEGDWIRVTGILAVTEHDGHVHPYLDVVTLETPEHSGSATVK